MAKNINLLTREYINRMYIGTGTEEMAVTPRQIKGI